MYLGNISIRGLETLLWIARLGGFGQAARRLNTTQPNVSMRIRELERQLGAQLVDRSRRAIRLTEAGRECVATAERMLALVGNLQQRVSDPKALVGTVRLGISEAVALSWLPTLVSRLNREYPGIVLELDVGMALTLRRKLDAGDVEVAILPGPMSQPDVVSEHLGALTFKWMASSRLKVPRRTLRPRDLAAWPIITLPRESNLHYVVEEWFAIDTVKARRLDVCNSLSVAAALTAGGVGISLLPPDLFRNDLAAGRLQIISVRPPISPTQFYAATKIGLTQPLAQVVTELARKVSTFRGKAA